MFFKSTIFAATLLLLPSALAASLAPRQTPNFFLFANAASPAFDRKLLKVSGTDASLTAGTDLKLYIDGNFLKADAAIPLTAYVDFQIGSTGSCNNFGDIIFIAGSTTNKCARSTTFSLLSFANDPQLGAKLTFPGGGLYVCPGGKIRFSTVAPGGQCEAINLWTIPTI